MGMDMDEPMAMILEVYFFYLKNTAVLCHSFYTWKNI